jgi:hypothetical protein
MGGRDVGGRPKSLPGKIVQADLPLDKIVEPNKLPELAELFKDILTPDIIKRKLRDSDSPAILQWILNQVYGKEGQGLSLTIEPLVLSVVQIDETVRVLLKRSLVSVPSEQVEGLKNVEDCTILTTPTPPNAPDHQNLSIDLGKDSEFLGLDGGGI